MKSTNNRSNVQKNGHRRTNSKYNSNNDNKFVSLVSKSIGSKAIITTNNDKFQGTLASFNPESFVVSKPSSLKRSDDLPSKLTINFKDLIDIYLDESNNSSSFKTDAAFSHGQYKERELQRWVPDESDLNNPVLNLNDDSHSNHQGWDQFKVNEVKFGIESTFDEHLYTTRIDTSAADYLEKVRKAEKIAQEIEKSSTTDAHILEERGVIVDDSGIDEEDKYSGVDRRGDDIMAALRSTNISDKNLNLQSQQQSQQQRNDPNATSVKPTPGKYSTPRQRAVEYHNDPAIVSSSATKKEQQQQQQQREQYEQQDHQLKSVSQPPNLPQSSSQTAPSPNAVKSSKPDSIPPKPPVTQQQHNESFRLNARSEINSLREFSANFKIPHKIPTDLLPILAKDKMKQDEILKKQTEQPPFSTSQQQPHQSQQQTPSQDQPKKKFDASKPAFKLNPKAAAFTPGKLKSPQPPKANYHRSPNNPSPSMLNSRPYSSGISNGGSSAGSTPKRHHQISPADFFGGANRIPTKASQEEKIKEFNKSFNFFTTTKNKFANSKTPIVYEKAFQTPPTWTSNIDESCDQLFSPVNSVNRSGAMGMATSPFVPGAMMNTGQPVPNLPVGYPNPSGSNYALSPPQQQQAAVMAAHYQQQQFQAAMLYQQQQFQGVPPGQPPMPMYGGEPLFMPPGAFMPPPQGFVGSPVNGNMMNQGGYNNNSNYNNHHNGARRYNNSHHNQTSSKRGGHN